MLAVQMGVALRFRMLCTGERHAGMMFGFHRCQPRSRVFLRVDMFFRTRDGRLRGIQFRRGDLGGTRKACRRDGLTRITHFLHGGAAAAGQAGDTDQYRD